MHSGNQCQTQSDAECGLPGSLQGLASGGHQLAANLALSNPKSWQKAYHTKGQKPAALMYVFCMMQVKKGAPLPWYTITHEGLTSAMFSQDACMHLRRQAAQPRLLCG